MTQDRADYSEISKVYDSARRLDKPHIEWWLKRLAEAGELGPGRRLLDLGCGTGRWTIPLVERTGCEAVGVDNSPDMLTRARVKDHTGWIEWLLGDAHAPSVPAESFDCALMSLMLHHLDEPLVAFRSAFAALRPGGVLLIRQGTLDQILDDPAHRFLPEAVTVDRKRTPFWVEVESWLSEAGYDGVAAETVQIPTVNSPEELLAESEARVCSVFRLIPEQAYARGVARLREYIEHHRDDPWLLKDDMTLFVARKPQ